ncbi:MAG: ABC transporter permease [Rhodoferax sp.]|uniref:ABC transporter permease n=1 Tax=Rhodoferax sp. TaxID=50421 RepID=UPI0032637DFB
MFDSAKYWRLASNCVAALVLAFLMLPLLTMVPLSFNSASILSYPLSGLSLKWYEAFMGDPRWISSILNSLLVAISTVAIATPLGTLAALGLSLQEFRGKSFLIAVLLSPMILPTIIAAVGMYFFFAPLGLANSLWGLVLAHSALATPFVLITVSASLHHLDPSLARAGASLGASPLMVFWRVTLPIVLPGVVSGGIFAFATSFDEVVVAMLLTGPEQRTLPRELLSGTRENLNPTIMAVATVLILVSTVLLFALHLVQQRSNKR